MDEACILKKWILVTQTRTKLTFNCIANSTKYVIVSIKLTVPRYCKLTGTLNEDRQPYMK